MNMRRFVALGSLIVTVIPVAALARDCNEVKAKIDAKIKAKGVANYVLQIVDGPDVKEGQIVGSCDVGAKRIVYFRNPSAKARSSCPRLRRSKQNLCQHHQQHRLVPRQVVELTGPASATASREARPAGAVAFIGSGPRSEAAGAYAGFRPVPVLLQLRAPSPHRDGEKGAKRYLLARDYNRHLRRAVQISRLIRTAAQPSDRGAPRARPDRRRRSDRQRSKRRKQDSDHGLISTGQPL